MFHHVPICSTAYHCLYAYCVFVSMQESNPIPLCPFEFALVASFCPRVSTSLTCLMLLPVRLITRTDVFS